MRPDPVLAGVCGSKSHAVLDPAIGAIVKANGTGIAVQALVQAARFPVAAKNDVKIVWRITGSGRPSFTTTGPGGAAARQTFGPELHDGSNWNAPGDEWGTGFRFPKAGCWAIHVRRATGNATAWLGVGI